MYPTARAWGLQLGGYARRVRLHDDSPAANVRGSDSVCRASEPAGHATNRCLGAAVGLHHVPTGWASTRGVPGINKHYGNTGQPGLVPDEGAKLVERPTGLDATLQPFEPLSVRGCP